MFDKILATIAPHSCCGCGQVGQLLCEHCENDIVSEPFDRCIACLRPSYTSNLCHDCHSNRPYDAAWVVGNREAALKHLIDCYKFERAQAADVVLARLLHERLPLLDPTTIITYVPTLPAHIRHRGYDHTLLIAKRLAALRALQYRPLLKKVPTVAQVGATHAQRLVQQRGSFIATGVNTNGPILIIDDIYTTGSTLTAATEALAAVHSQPVHVAVIARQLLQK